MLGRPGRQLRERLDLPRGLVGAPAVGVGAHQPAEQGLAADQRAAVELEQLGQRRAGLRAVELHRYASRA